MAARQRKLLEYELNVAVAKRWKGTVAATEAEAFIAIVRASMPSDDLVEHCRRLRGSVSRERVAPERVEVSAEAALARFEQRWRNTLDKLRAAEVKYAEREWLDATGRQVTARLEHFFADQVVLSMERGTSFVIKIEDLSEADQAYVREVTAPPDPEELARSERALLRHLQLRQIGAAVARYHSLHRVFPPPAIVDDKGQPLISWRVLLLPQLGGQELFELFRLDEPWNSEHNKRLAAFVPSVYRLENLDNSPTNTPILRLTGPQTASPANQLIRYADIVDGKSNTVFAVIAANAHAVMWTKPEDLAVDEKADFADKLDWRDNQTTVLTCDGGVSSIDSSSVPYDWYHRACRDDGR